MRPVHDVEPTESGASTAVIVPPYIVNTPGACVTPAPVTCGSAGIGNVFPNVQGLTPRHGFASNTDRLKVVM